MSAPKSAGKTLWIVLLAAGAVPAAAQDTTRVVLPPITVDALRAGVPLARLPLAATVLDSLRTLEAGSGFALDAPLRGIPGVQLDDRHNQAMGERVSVRGFGARASFGIRGVHVRVDGIPATMPDGQTTLNHVDPAAIAGAEVVRGPAAAFLGNAAGGALLLRTGVPTGIGGELQLGAAGQQVLALSAAGARGAAGYHVRGSRQQADGWRAWSASERWLLNAGGRLATGPGRGSVALHAVHYDAQNPGSLTAEQLAADPRQPNANNVRQQTGERGTHVQAGLGWELPLPVGNLSVRAYGGVRSLDNPIPPRIIELERGFGGAGVQLVRRAAESLTLSAGLDLGVQHDQRRNWVNEDGARGEQVLDQRERVLATAARASAVWLPGRGLDILVAGRWDRHGFRVRDALIAADDPDDSGTRTLDALSGAVGLGWSAHPAARLFVAAGTAFETPTTTELANRPDGAGGFNPLLEPERTRSLEAGVRGGSAVLRYELVAFAARVADKLIPFEIAAAPGRQFYRNAGITRHRGVEAAIEVQLPDVATAWGSWTRLDARFREYRVEGVSFSGRRVPGVAGHQLEGGVQSAPVHGWRARMHVRHTGMVAVDDANTAFADAYTLSGARVDGRIAVAGLVLEPFAGIDNALDRRYVAAVTVNAFGSRYYEPGPGRSAYGGLRIRWR